MEKDIHTIMELVGNKNRFTIFIIGMNLFLWINVSILNYSLAFIETKPKVTYIKDGNEITEKLKYDICDKYDFIIKEDYKYSIITDFEDGTECNKLKNSLIGTINSIGILLGNFLFHMISGKFGYKNILFIFHICHAIFLLVSIFWDNYYFFQVINCFVMFFTKCILNSSLVMNNEIVDLKYKAMISSFVNSGLGLGGMFYVLMYYLLKDWRYVFIVGVCLSAISGIIIKIFFHDSLVQSLINKDFEKFYNNLLYIAKMNGREKEFKEGIVNDEKYKNCLEKLKKYTEKESVIKYNKKVDGTTNIVHIDQNQINIESDNNHQSNNNLISPKLSTNNENSTGIKKEIKGSLLQIFKYSSVRYILIILSVGWFCNSTLFYGLVIGIKTLKGSQYRNTAILYLCDFCAYNISGFFSNSKLGRRLSLQIFTLGYGIFCLVMFLVFDKNKDVVVGFYFCARLFMICGFCVYYSYAFESYPISVATYGYSFNATCSSIAGVVIPFIIEYIEEKYVFLIYAIEGVICTFLFLFLKETRGKEREDNIKEIEEQLNKDSGNAKEKENNEKKKGEN
jgi:hypothetical protein